MQEKKDINNNNNIKIGIYGGTFAPPHLGHMQMCRTFAEFGESPLHRLDKIFVIPTAVPPHKKMDHENDPQMRLEMLRMALKPVIDEFPQVEISDFEIRNAGASYTYITLEHFRDLNYSDITLLCGGDMFLTLDRWVKPDRIFSLAKIAYVVRNGIELDECAEKYRRLYGARVEGIKMAPVNISSSQIRRMLSEKDVRAKDYLSGEVYDFILEHHLYGS